MMIRGGKVRATATQSLSWQYEYIAPDLLRLDTAL